MVTNWVQSCLKNLLRARRRRGCRRGAATFRPRMEALERRLAPAAGALDLTFGSGGKVITDFDTTFERGNAVALQTDGKIIVVGTTDQGGSGTNFAVARYNANGTLDTSFSGDGKTATDFDGGSDEATGVAIQANGKIVVA